MGNKAHTATARRIARRYNGVYPGNEGQDIVAQSLLIAVETSATLSVGLARLTALVGQRYIAVTNKEALSEALLLTAGTPIGVMDPLGNIIKTAVDETSNGQP